MAAMALMNNVSLDDSQRISILPSCSNNKDASALGDNASSNDYIKTIKYESLAAVRRQMDRGKSNQNNTTTLVTNSAHAFGPKKCARKPPPNGRKPMTIQEAIEAKRKRKSKTCTDIGSLITKRTAP